MNRRKQKDMTELQWEEENAQRYSEICKNIVDRTKEVIWDWDLVKNHIWWSENYYSWWGYKRELPHQQADTFKDGIHFEDRQRVFAELDEIYKHKTTCWSTEYRFLKANFTIVNILSRATIFYDSVGKARRILGSMIDVSDRKKKEQDLLQRNNNLTSLSVYLQEKKERENQMVAYEMHEQLAQELAGLNLKIHSLFSQIPAADTALREQFNDINKALVVSINRVRQLSAKLYPAILMDLGFKEAFCSYCFEFSAQNAIVVKFSCEEEIGLAAHQVLPLYRSFQQALSNSILHEACEIICSVRVEKNEILITVCDDGKNFLKAEELKESLEWQAMKERLASIQARLAIDIDWTEGTSTTITLPQSQLL